MPLTVIQIENAKCKEKLYKLTDGEGLTLFVEPKGGKYWRFRYRHAGQEKKSSRFFIYIKSQDFCDFFKPDNQEISNINSA